MESFIKQKLVEIITKKIMEEAIRKMAFLSWGPLGGLASFFVSKILTKALEAGLMELGILMTNLEVNREVSKIKDATKKVKEAKNEEELQRAEKELEEAAWDLISFG